MPNYFLNKVDSMSMLNSVEVRNPFITGIIRRNASTYLIKDIQIKRKALFESYKNILPHEIIKRKKLGFTREFRYF